MRDKQKVPLPARIRLGEDVIPMIEEVEPLSQSERVLAELRELERLSYLANDLGKPRGRVDELPDVRVRGHELLYVRGVEPGDVGFECLSRSLELSEDVVGPDGGILDIGTGLAVEAQGLFEIEGDHGVARVTEQEVTQRADRDRPG